MSYNVKTITGTNGAEAFDFEVEQELNKSNNIIKVNHSVAITENGITLFSCQIISRSK